MDINLNPEPGAYKVMDKENHNKGRKHVIAGDSKTQNDHEVKPAGRTLHHNRSTNATGQQTRK